MAALPLQFCEPTPCSEIRKGDEDRRDAGNSAFEFFQVAGDSPSPCLDVHPGLVFDSHAHGGSVGAGGQSLDLRELGHRLFESDQECLGLDGRCGLFPGVRLLQCLTQRVDVGVVVDTFGHFEHGRLVEDSPFVFRKRRRRYEAVHSGEGIIPFTSGVSALGLVAWPAEVPFPPVERFGLPEFAPMQQMTFAGITFKDTFFLQEGQSSESLHFHELVHVVQWARLGVDSFLLAYGVGLIEFGYEQSPLEQMAYAFQRDFERGTPPQELVHIIEERTDAIWNQVAPVVSRGRDGA